MIREMKSSDWEQVREIYCQGIEEGTSTFTVSCPPFEQWNAAHHPFCRYVSEKNGEVRGWLALSPVSAREPYGGVAEISLYVDRSYRGTGIGTALIEHLCAECEKHGIWSLLSVIFASNAASIALHEKCGFRKIGFREKIAKDRFGEWQDTFMYEKRLPVK